VEPGCFDAISSLPIIPVHYKQIHEINTKWLNVFSIKTIGLWNNSVPYAENVIMLVPKSLWLSESKVYNSTPCYSHKGSKELREIEPIECLFIN